MRFFLLFIILSITNVLHAQNFIELHAQKLAQDIEAVLQAHNITHSKIAVRQFHFSNSTGDSMLTELGSELQLSLSHKLEQVFEQSGLYNSVLYPDASLYKEINSLSSEVTYNSDYWKRIYKGQLPDYYVVGEYETGDDFFRTYRVRLVKRSVDTIIEFAIPEVTTQLTPADIASLSQRHIYNDISQLSKYLASIILSKVKSQQVKLGAFYYEPTQSPTEFSVFFLNNLTTWLTTYNINVIRTTRALFDQIQANYTMSGSYTVKGQNLVLNIYLKKGKNDKIVLSKIIYLDTAAIEDLAIKPDNEEIAEQRVEEIKKIELRRNDFYLDVYTNKGKDNIVLKKDEVYWFYVITDREAYLRFVYILADNTPVLMLDNVKITADKVNRPYRIPSAPQAFKCAWPFGTETLYVIASTRPFKPVQTSDYYGYKKIEAQDFREVISKTRGFANTMEQPESILFAEKVLNFTTVE